MDVEKVAQEEGGISNGKAPMTALLQAAVMDESSRACPGRTHLEATQGVIATVSSPIAATVSSPIASGTQQADLTGRSAPTVCSSQCVSAAADSTERASTIGTRRPFRRTTSRMMKLAAIGRGGRGHELNEVRDEVVALKAWVSDVVGGTEARLEARLARIEGLLKAGVQAQAVGVMKSSEAAHEARSSQQEWLAKQESAANNSPSPPNSESAPATAPRIRRTHQLPSTRELNTQPSYPRSEGRA